MARVRMNRGDPDRLAMGRVPPMDLMVETPNDCTYADSNEHLFGSVFNGTIEDQTSGQLRAKGARSGQGKKGGVKPGE